MTSYACGVGPTGPSHAPSNRDGEVRNNPGPRAPGPGPHTITSINSHSPPLYASAICRTDSPLGSRSHPPSLRRSRVGTSVRLRYSCDRTLQCFRCARDAVANSTEPTFPSVSLHGHSTSAHTHTHRTHTALNNTGWRTRDAGPKPCTTTPAIRHSPCIPTLSTSRPLKRLSGHET